MRAKQTLRKATSDLIDVHVLNTDGEHLGEVSDFQINMLQGRIEFVEIHLDIDNSKNGVSVKVPWSQFTWRNSGKGAELKVSRKNLIRFAVHSSEPDRK